MGHSKSGKQASVSALALAVLVIASAAYGQYGNGFDHSLAIRTAASVSLMPGEKAAILVSLDNKGGADLEKVALSSVPEIVSFGRNNVSLPSGSSVNLSAIVSAPKQEGRFIVTLIARSGRSTESTAMSVNSSRSASASSAPQPALAGFEPHPASPDSQPAPDASILPAPQQAGSAPADAGSLPASAGSAPVPLSGPAPQPALAGPAPEAPPAPDFSVFQAPVPVGGPAGLVLLARRTASPQGTFITLLGVLVLACIVLSESTMRGAAWSAAWGHPKTADSAVSGTERGRPGTAGSAVSENS